MSGQITHSWNGTVLTISSDSGTSSVDLKGDTGCRGPQGRPGIVYDAEGNVVMEGYATEQYVNDLLENVEFDEYATKVYVDNAVASAEPDLDGYATEEYVDIQITNVATGGSIDLSNYATKDYVDNHGTNIDNKTIKTDSNGVISTVIGGYQTGLAYQEFPNLSLVQTGAKTEDVATIKEVNEQLPVGTVLSFQIKYIDGNIDTFTGQVDPEAHTTFYEDTSYGPPMIMINMDARYISGFKACRYYHSTRDVYFWRFKPTYVSEYALYKVSEINMAFGHTPGGEYVPINANFIPVDGETITIKDGKLTVIGGSSIASSEEVEY